MKNIILLCLLVYSSTASSQDTLSKSPHYGGGATNLIVFGDDSVFVSTYPNGKIESKRMYSLKNDNLPYQRYYPNGNLMWEKFIKNGKSNGLASYYNMKGKKVATFLYENDQITDTLFIAPKAHLLFGRVTYYSVVHGGMEREDGGSNISGGSGVNMYYPMYVVKLDTTKKSQAVYQEFYTDYDGYYFLCLEEGSFGFFPKSHAISNVKSTMGAPESDFNGSSSSGWDLEVPFKIQDQKYQYLELHYHSVGYAP